MAMSEGDVEYNILDMNKNLGLLLETDQSTSVSMKVETRNSLSSLSSFTDIDEAEQDLLASPLVPHETPVTFDEELPRETTEEQHAAEDFIRIPEFPRFPPSAYVKSPETLVTKFPELADSIECFPRLASILHQHHSVHISQKMQTLKPTPDIPSPPLEYGTDIASKRARRHRQQRGYYSLSSSSGHGLLSVPHRTLEAFKYGILGNTPKYMSVEEVETDDQEAQVGDSETYPPPWTWSCNTTDADPHEGADDRNFLTSTAHSVLGRTSFEPLRQPRKRPTALRAPLLKLQDCLDQTSELLSTAGLATLQTLKMIIHRISGPGAWMIRQPKRLFRVPSRQLHSEISQERQRIVTRLQTRLQAFLDLDGFEMSISMVLMSVPARLGFLLWDGCFGPGGCCGGGDGSCCNSHEDLLIEDGNGARDWTLSGTAMSLEACGSCETCLHPALLGVG
ncbi:MAG: galactokinase [Chaenotheca gracillima]|nr:MAG: galactokinase [Chaenotheca gracillima]